jgi:hypothetical protein
MDWSAPLVIQGGALTVLLTVVTVFFRMIATGALVPRKTVDDMIRVQAERMADKRTQIAEWREAHRISEVAREKQDSALREALEVARAAEQALRGFRVATERLAETEGGA